MIFSRPQEIILPVDHEKAITLGTIFSRYKYRIIVTYFLYTLDYTIYMLQPLVLGLAIDGLLKNDYWGIILFGIQHVSQLLVGSLRRINDTRTFTFIYSRIAEQLVYKLRKKQVDNSLIVARVGLSKEMTGFYENDVTTMFNCVYGVGGALFILSFYDSHLLLYCILLFIPELVINYFYSKRIKQLNKGLNDQKEMEVAILDNEGMDEVKKHFGLLAKWNVKLSDAEALNFALIEFFILGLILASIIYFCNLPGKTAGEIFAVFQYVIRFVMGLDTVPQLTNKIVRLKDIQKRINDSMD